MTTSFALAAMLALTLVLTNAAAADNRDWTIHILNDNCPDYTWGFTEQQTRRAFADIVAAHLDQMNATDANPESSRDRYNMAVTQEAICFVEEYPNRKDELIARIKQQRIFVSPYLCNSLWGMQSIEGALRTCYPAARLQREWGISIDAAEHIECPSLPWGTATILSGCGIRWLSVPFYNYDSTFGQLRNPPLFILQGPDGSNLRVVMDPWACNKSSYMQGKAIFAKPDSLTKEWLPHYQSLGAAYPLRHILASGTHGDIAPDSGKQAATFASAIARHNANARDGPQLFNATLPHFCQTVDAAQDQSPFMPTMRGCFGHSWELWPVSLSKYVAAMREGERRFLAAETLVALAGLRQGSLVQATQQDRRRAEWCLAMLSDHAWNGTDETNKRHNAQLRRGWSEELNQLAGRLTEQAWTALSPKRSEGHLTLFSPISVPRRSRVTVPLPAGAGTVAARADGRELNCQVVEESGEKLVCFVSPELKGFGWCEIELSPAKMNAAAYTMRNENGMLEGPFFRITINPRNGGVSSIIHKPTGQELVDLKQGGRTVCQTVYFDGKDHLLNNIQVAAQDVGPVLARARVSGDLEGIRVTTFITVYAELDQVDFDVHVNKPVSKVQQRLCQFFPLLDRKATLRVETPAAVIRPRHQPEGDLLPGADPRRLAVGGFIDVSTSRLGVTIVPLDVFAMRLDLDAPAFEVLGNDQNYREVIQDQDGVTQFRFRYALRAHAGDYRQAEAVAWSRAAAMPVLGLQGRLPPQNRGPAITVDRTRAVATCLKPVDTGAPGCILRLWETGGQDHAISLGLGGFRVVRQIDLLERGTSELAIQNGHVNLPARPHGIVAVHIAP